MTQENKSDFDSEGTPKGWKVHPEDAKRLVRDSFPCRECGGKTQHAASCPDGGVCPMPREQSDSGGGLDWWDRPAPQTDTAVKDHLKVGYTETVRAGFARALEQQLAEAIEKLAKAESKRCNGVPPEECADRTRMAALDMELRQAARYVVEECVRRCKLPFNERRLPMLAVMVLREVLNEYEDQQQSTQFTSETKP